MVEYFGPDRVVLEHYPFTMATPYIAQPWIPWFLQGDHRYQLPVLAGFGPCPHHGGYPRNGCQGLYPAAAR